MNTLDTTKPPSSEFRTPQEDLDSLRQLASNKKKVLDEYLIRIAALQDELEALRHQLPKIMKSYNHTVTLTAPIRQIPDEILEQILRDTVPSLFFHDKKLQPFSVKSVWGGRLKTMMVCQRWNRIIRDMPSCWSEIVIGDWVPRTYLLRSLELSKSHPLDMHIWGPPKTYAAEETIKLLCNNMARIRLLSLQTSDAELFLNDLPSIPISMPKLRLLNIQPEYSHGVLYRRTYQPLVQFILPNLTALELDINPDVLGSLRQNSLLNLQMVKATLEPLYLGSLLELSKAAPNIHTLEIQLNFDRKILSSIQRINFPTLCTFSVRARDLKCISLIVQALELPRVRKANIEYQEGKDSSEMNEPLDIKWPTLEILQLKNFRLNPFTENQKALFDSIPALRSLYLTNCMRVGTFFHHIIRTNGKQRKWPWPNLNHLSVDSQKTLVSDNDLKDFILAHPQGVNNAQNPLRVYFANPPSQLILDTFPGVIHKNPVLAFDEE
ncbi:hypothetical protein M422DRAFT_42906 [Sphaerobolus stellatus SS14]|nr:hypothetical protein M422DRAFT_42906 [Sphaerobolus stellatus SS14]